jgi:malonyl-CoA decarboxylase
VEVALLAEMPDAIGPLIDVRSESQSDARQFKVAAFYSISNCQPGLKGVSLGNFLIKRVAEHLHREFPQIRTYCTLSPIPGFSAWLTKNAAILAEPDEAKEAKARPRARLQEAVATLREAGGGELGGVASLDPQATPEAVREALLALASFYLARESVTQRGDPVAKFHLGNGARLERLNPAADRSRKGLKQSFGMMVNYLYDLRHVEDQHERFVNGEVVASRAILRLL